MIADFQTSGKGRFDRKWVAEINSALLMSVSFSADAEKVNLGVFASGIAVASCAALRSLGFEQVRIKWPNDIVVETSSIGGQEKLAGVLAQSKLVRARASVVVGICINAVGYIYKCCWTILSMLLDLVLKNIKMMLNIFYKCCWNML